MATSGAQQRPTRPLPVGVITAVVGAEAAVLAVTGLRLAASLFSPHVLPVGGIVFGALVLFVAAAWLGAAARDTWRGRRWTRAAVLVSQVFLLVVGVSLAQVGLPVLGFGCVAAAAVTLVFLFTRATTAWLNETTGP